MTKTFTNIDVALPHLASHVMIAGSEVGSRLGERTMEVLHQQTVLTEPWQREVLVPGRNANIAAQIAETMWVLAGRNDVEFLSHYLPRAKDFSDDGVTWRGGYGPRLRGWRLGDGSQIDQVKHVVDLLTKDRASRRAVISIYDPETDTRDGKDIPCNDFLSFISREGALHLSVFVRSNDLIWGWSGINAFEWSALQEIVAAHLGLMVGDLVFNTTSLHIYDRHWSRVGRFRVDPVMRTFQDSPRYAPEDRSFETFDALVKDWFGVEEELRAGRDVPVDDFPEPMLRSWLQVIGWYWTGDEKYLKPLEDTRLWVAVQHVPRSIREQVANRGRTNAYLLVSDKKQPVVGDRVDVYPVWTGTSPASTFVAYVDNLHREKSAAYGDSWKKRGEQMSILANIARKIDRLESGGTTGDETSADTAIDLLVYLIKYRLWLSETHRFVSAYVPEGDGENGKVAVALRALREILEGRPAELEARTARLLGGFSSIEDTLKDRTDISPGTARAQVLERTATVGEMILDAFVLARTLWEKEQAGPDYQNPYRNLTDADG